MKRRHILSLSAALVASAAVSVPTAVPASGTTSTTTPPTTTATLFALEIFAPEPGAAAGPRCATQQGDVQPAASADLPAGTVPNAVIQGRLPNGVRGCRVVVRAAGQRIAVYKSAETQIRKPQLLRSGVKVIASRDERTGVLVAERIVGRGVNRNEVERDFTATVTVDSTGDNWVTTEIGGTGRQFTFDTTTAPADIELGLGSTVSVQFDTVAPPPC
jgi:hypothetical protein